MHVERICHRGLECENVGQRDAWITKLSDEYVERRGVLRCVRVEVGRSAGFEVKVG